MSGGVAMVRYRKDGVTVFVEIRATRVADLKGVIALLDFVDRHMLPGKREYREADARLAEYKRLQAVERARR